MVEGGKYDEDKKRKGIIIGAFSLSSLSRSSNEQLISIQPN